MRYVMSSNKHSASKLPSLSRPARHFAKPVPDWASPNVSVSALVSPTPTDNPADSPLPSEQIKYVTRDPDFITGNCSESVSSANLQHLFTTKWLVDPNLYDKDFDMAVTASVLRTQRSWRPKDSMGLSLLSPMQLERSEVFRWDCCSCVTRSACYLSVELFRLFSSVLFQTSGHPVIVPYQVEVSDLNLQDAVAFVQPSSFCHAWYHSCLGCTGVLFKRAPTYGYRSTGQDQEHQLCLESAIVEVYLPHVSALSKLFQTGDLIFAQLQSAVDICKMQIISVDTLVGSVCKTTGCWSIVLNTASLLTTTRTRQNSWRPDIV